MTRRLLLAALLAGCAADGLPPADEVDCAASPLRYDNFGADFLGEHCQSCHGARADQRQGAPPEYDFGTLEAVRRFRGRIYARAAAGNTTMPPGPDDPPAEARALLGEWLACGAP